MRKIRSERNGQKRVTTMRQLISRLHDSVTNRLRNLPKMAPSCCTLIANRTRQSILMIQSKPFLSLDREESTHSRTKVGKCKNTMKLSQTKFSIYNVDGVSIFLDVVQLVYLISSVTSHLKLDTCRTHPI